MKLLNTAPVEYTLQAMSAHLPTHDGKMLVLLGDDVKTNLFKLELAPKGLKITYANPDLNATEGDLTDLSFETEDKLHYRGIHIDGRDLLAFWTTPKLGTAIQALTDLRQAIQRVGRGEVKRLTIPLTDEAILAGWEIKSDETGYHLFQVPTWAKGENRHHGRVPVSVEDFAFATDGIFLNDYIINFFTDSTGVQATWYPESNEFILEKESSDSREFETFHLPLCEEVNYNSPAIAEAGLVAPSQDLEVIYEDPTGRRVGYLRETFDGRNYDTYAMRHGIEGVEDQITLGSEAVYNEQIFALLIHRFKTLDSELPHDANKETIALLERALKLQTDRYTQRKEEGIYGTDEQSKVEPEQKVETTTAEQAEWKTPTAEQLSQKHYIAPAFNDQKADNAE